MEYKYVELENCPICLSEKYDILNSKKVFRLAKNKICDNKDFIPIIIDKRQSYRCKKICKDNNCIQCCKCYGLSVEIDIEGLKRRFIKFPNLGNNIFYAIIEKEGDIYLTKSRE